MKTIKQHIFEKLKVSKPDYPIYKCADDFEYLFNTIVDICKSRVKDKSDFIQFGYYLAEYFNLRCKAKSENWSKWYEVDGNNYNDHSMYFIQHYDKCEIGLHYDNVTYYFTYKYSKFKIEKFEDEWFSYWCKYKGGSLYESAIFEFPEKMIIDFADNIVNNL